MIKSYELTDKHKKFIPKLIGWLEGYTTDFVWVKGSRMRDKVFFTDLIRKVGLLGEYNDIDRENLQWITEEYMADLRGAKEYIIDMRAQGFVGGSTINKP